MVEITDNILKLNVLLTMELANFIADRFMDEVERGEKPLDGQLIIDIIESYKMGVR